jgi:alkylhydroperoxidase/carboxymuconolactone decarboxylase family protein YurZ
MQKAPMGVLIFPYDKTPYDESMDGGTMKELQKVSSAFVSFAQNAQAQQKIWLEAALKLGESSALDKKTQAFAYISVLAVMRLESGLPFHVTHAKSLGASREEVISAILVGLPAAGNVVVQSIPVAVHAYDNGV